MIYFDNAATGGFKPRAVTDSANNVIRYLSVNPGRSGHFLSLAAQKTVYECRVALAELFNCKDIENIVFTLNTTYALNIAIKALVSKKDHVLISNIEPFSHG